MTKLMADRRAKEARDDEVDSRSPYPATRAQAQKRLAMTDSLQIAMPCFTGIDLKEAQLQWSPLSL